MHREDFKCQMSFMLRLRSALLDVRDLVKTTCVGSREGGSSPMHKCVPRDQPIPSESQTALSMGALPVHGTDCCPGEGAWLKGLNSGWMMDPVDPCKRNAYDDGCMQTALHGCLWHGE